MIITTENPLPKVYYETLGLKEKQLWHISKVKEWHNEDVTGIITSLSKEILDLSTFENLKWVATPTTGHDHLDMDRINEKEIKIISLQGESEFLSGVWATAEHTMALIFALAKNIIQNQKLTEKHGWERAYKSIELAGKNLLIIGNGRVGKQVRFLAEGLEMYVTAIDKDNQSDLARLLWNADFVSIHVNNIKENYRMCNQAFFQAMNPNAFFINTSRGEVVSEPALLTALCSGGIKGAAIDVVCDEHLGTMNDKLFEHARIYGNLIITPHVAGYTSESRAKTDEFLAKKIKDYLILEEFSNAILQRKQG